MATNDIGAMSLTAAGLVMEPGGLVLPGVGWSVTKMPTFQTRIQRAVSGRELRAQDYPSPLWQFQLTFNFLRDGQDTRIGPGLGSGYDELRTLYGLYLACAGAFGTFLFLDPTDSNRIGMAVGVGDSSTSSFQLQTQWGFSPSFVGPVYAVQQITAVYLNGLTQTPGTYSCAAGLNSTGLLTFDTPPLSGVQITADFVFYFRCRFVDDSYSFENFMYQLWQLKKLTFITVFP
jgi:uncharacterized protein (TIGR02217 family)